MNKTSYKAINVQRGLMCSFICKRNTKAKGHNKIKNIGLEKDKAKKYIYF